VRKSLLFLFVDALGPAQLARLAERDVGLPHHTTLRGELGFSSGALATLLTGAAPAQHGRMCLFQRAARGPSFLAPLALLGLLPRWVHERGPVRRGAARLFARLHGLEGYFALHRVPPSLFAELDVPERDDLFQSETIGGEPTFLATARAAGLSVYASPWQLPEDARFAHAERGLREAPDLAFLYSAELDGALHAEGTESAAEARALDRVARRLERARSILRQSGVEPITVVVGDHGMANIRRVIDPAPLVEAAGGKVFVDSTLLRVWGGSSERLRAALEREKVPGRLLERAELATRGTPTLGDPYGEKMVVLDEGALFAPSYVGGVVRGMHGYDVGTPSSGAALASDAAIPPRIQGLRDVAGLVHQHLGLP
jgi:hypothetical protein